MTPRELFREFAAHDLVREDVHDRDVSQAWHTARLLFDVWHRKKLPALSTQLIKKSARKPPTMAQQVSVLHVLSAQWGIPLRKAKGKKKR